MSRADCIVLPTYHEGMSNVLLEGASMGLPLIASDIHGCKEAIEEGVTGLLCQPKDWKSLADAMMCFANLTKEQQLEMGRLGRAKMIREFNRDIVISQYVAMIRKEFANVNGEGENVND